MTALRFAVSVNGRQAFVVGIPGNGHVGVHINGYSGREPPARVHGATYHSPSEQETISQKWEGVAVALGDRIEVALTDAEPTPPTTTRTSTENPGSCVRDAELARRIDRLVGAFAQELEEFVPAVNASESPEDAKQFRRAVGRILMCLLDEIKRPLWDAHPELQPEGWRRHDPPE
jgi:hypothetical protein